MEDKDSESIRHQFLKNIGGQVHVKCSQHCMPLINSMYRHNKCACGKKEQYRCCDVNCKL